MSPLARRNLSSSERLAALTAALFAACVPTIILSWRGPSSRERRAALPAAPFVAFVAMIRVTTMRPDQFLVSGQPSDYALDILFDVGADGVPEECAEARARLLVPVGPGQKRVHLAIPVEDEDVRSVSLAREVSVFVGARRLVLLQSDDVAREQLGEAKDTKLGAPSRYRESTFSTSRWPWVLVNALFVMTGDERCLLGSSVGSPIRWFVAALSRKMNLDFMSCSIAKVHDCGRRRTPWSKPRRRRTSWGRAPWRWPVALGSCRRHPSPRFAGL